MGVSLAKNHVGRDETKRIVATYAPAALGRELVALPKYRMTSHPIRDLCERIAPSRNRAFSPSTSVTLTIGPDECPEQLGDELRRWCRDRCTGRWKQMTRGVRGIIVMGFESALDAAMFRASALNDCRAVIAANEARRRAAMRRASR